MEMGETLYEWREREFVFDRGLGCYEFYVEAEAAHEHRVIGDVPTTIACWLSFIDSSFGGKVEFDLCMSNAEERDEAVATVTQLRDALNRVLAAIEDASEVVEDQWEAESDAASE
jgi:hypothetical protein